MIYTPFTNQSYLKSNEAEILLGFCSLLLLLAAPWLWPSTLVEYILKDVHGFNCGYGNYLKSNTQYRSLWKPTPFPVAFPSRGYCRIQECTGQVRHGWNKLIQYLKYVFLITEPKTNIHQFFSFKLKKNGILLHSEYLHKATVWQEIQTNSYSGRCEHV